MRWTWCSAALLGLLTAHAWAEEPGCVYRGMELRLVEVIEPCTRVLANKQLSKEDRAAALFVRGRAYHSLYKLEPAFQDYNAALELTPNDATMLLVRAGAYDWLGQRDLKLADLAKAAEIAPKNTRVLVTLGNLYSDSGNSQRAIELYSEAIAIDPNKTFAFIYRKDEYLRLKDLPRALADADASVRAAQVPSLLEEPNFFIDWLPRDLRAVTLVERAAVLEMMGEMDRAKQDYDTAVAIDQSGYALIRRARFTKGAASIPDLEEAVRREPRNIEALYSLGLRHMGEKRYDAALPFFNRSIEIDPSDGYSLRMRARIHREFGRTDEAFEDMMRAVFSDRRILPETMLALRTAGYWHSIEIPDQITAALADALRACMVDTTCN